MPRVLQGCEICPWCGSIKPIGHGANCSRRPASALPFKVGDVVRLRGDKRFWRIEKLRPALYCDVCLISLCENQVRTEVNRKWVTIVPA